jgi:hypothetical protein
METQQEPNQTEESRKLIDLAEITFKTVLDADVHQDDKASRILSGMAFLTAAAAAIFAKAYSPGIASGDLLKLSQTLAPFVNPSDLPSVVDNVTRAIEKQPLMLLGLDLAHW